MTREGAPTATIKQNPEDWRVDEALALAPSGEGEHALYLVEKIGHNTTDIASELARVCGVPGHAVGYCGRKDKHAVTRQWFSVPTSADTFPLEMAGVRCLESRRHSHKLRIGEHAGNRFEIRLRSVSRAPDEALRAAVSAPLPNAFGPQRCSPDNVERASAWLAKRRSQRISKRQRGWYLSVLRAYLFNAVLAPRATDGTFATPIDGDELLGGLPTGPLWGRGRSATQGRAAEIEAAALEPFAEMCTDIEYAGVQQGRRAFALVPEDIAWQELPDGDAIVRFSLPPGGYATSVLAHHFNVTDASRCDGRVQEGAR